MQKGEMLLSEYSEYSDYSDYSDHSDHPDYSDHSDYSDYSDHPPFIIVFSCPTFSFFLFYQMRILTNISTDVKNTTNNFGISLILSNFAYCVDMLLHLCHAIFTHSSRCIYRHTGIGWKKGIATTSKTSSAAAQRGYALLQNHTWQGKNKILSYDNSKQWVKNRKIPTTNRQTVLMLL